MTLGEQDQLMGYTNIRNAVYKMHMQHHQIITSISGVSERANANIKCKRVFLSKFMSKMKVSTRRMLAHYVNLYRKCNNNNGVDDEEPGKMRDIFKGYEEKCTELCADILKPSLEPSDLADSPQRSQMRELAHSLIELMCVFVSKSAVLAVNYHISAHIRPQIALNRKTFTDIESLNHQQLVIKKNCGGHHQSSSIFLKMYEEVMTLSRNIHQFSLPRIERQKKIAIAKRVAILEALYYSTTFGDGEVEWHFRMDYFNFQTLWCEFKTLSGLFGVCSCLPSLMMSEEANAKTIMDWGHGDISQIFPKLVDVAPMFKFLFCERVGFGNHYSKISLVFRVALTELARNIMFLGHCDSIDAYIIRNTTASKYFSAMLERGHMLVPRLKRWIMAVHRIAMVNLEIHLTLYAVQVDMLYV